MKTAERAPSAAEIGRRIAEIAGEISALERSGPSLAERLAGAEAELAQARGHFERFGFATVGVVPAERFRNFQRSVIGALMTIDGGKITASERARIEASGGLGISETEKGERLAALRSELRPLLAQREAAWRSEETAGRTADRSQFDPEMYLASDADLALVAAAGKEA
jgi:hypothetical protein